MISIKTPQEIEIMKKCGEITSKALKEVLDAVEPGVSTLKLDSIAEDVIRSYDAFPSFMTVDDYKYTTCINVNAGIVHGIPNEYELKQGDVVSVDLGAYYKNFHTDLSYTLEVESNLEEHFLNVGKQTLIDAINLCRPGKRIGDISNLIQTRVEEAGYSVSKDLVGHGVGRELHEEPHIPCYGKANAGPEIKVGMTFAVEVIYQKGRSDLILSEDGWTLETQDGSLSGLFENTIGITKNGLEQITSFN